MVISTFLLFLVSAAHNTEIILKQSTYIMKLIMLSILCGTLF
jgi:hypothetical protein